MKVGVNKLLRAGMVPARVELRRQMEAGKKEYDFLVLVHGSFWPCSRGGTFHLDNSVLGRRRLEGKMVLRTKRSMAESDRKVQMWRHVRGPAGAVMCETRDLGVKWPCWYTLIFEGDRNINMRYVPKKCQENASAADQ